MIETGRQRMIESVKAYFEARNSASRELFAQVLAPDCVHYFPPEAGGPYRGAEAIADLWIGFVREKDSRWTIERIACDGKEICVEWTHWKPAAGERIRGSEWYEFDEQGRISAIWVHYAAPRDASRAANELEGFDYEERGYSLKAPELCPATLERRRLALEGGSGGG